MKNRFSILFLLIFLFPIAEKGLHNFEHRADLHCTSTDKHFHDLEHHCSICDFIIFDSQGSPNTNYGLLVFEKKFLFQSFIEFIGPADTFEYLPARAPPIV